VEGKVCERLQTVYALRVEARKPPMRLLQFRVEEEDAAFVDRLKARFPGLEPATIQRLIFMNGVIRVRERGTMLIESEVGHGSSADAEKDLSVLRNQLESADGIETGASDRGDSEDREVGKPKDKRNARRRR
jgi:hypothetical protein